MVTRRTYPVIKFRYFKLFKVVDNYINQHPDAVLEYDEMSEEDPTLGFVHREGIINVHTVFVLKPKRE